MEKETLKKLHKILGCKKCEWGGGLSVLPQPLPTNIVYEEQAEDLPYAPVRCLAPKVRSYKFYCASYNLSIMPKLQQIMIKRIIQGK